MSEFDELFNRLLTLEDAEFDFPKSIEDIELFEQKSGVKLPESYKAFLLRFGEVSVLGNTKIAGIEEGCFFSILSNTQSMQERWNMPSNLLVLQPDEDAPYCFDLKTSQSNGEYNIVCYELGKSYYKIADNFPKWVEDFVLYVDEDANEEDS